MLKFFNISTDADDPDANVEENYRKPASSSGGGKPALADTIGCPKHKANVSPSFCEEEKCDKIDGCKQYQGYKKRG